ncbi:MAG: molybdopterin synthase catalytic subunit MoaE [Gammaproteobacteria bacterium CG22_combo_CG10-13_8_21_14_all_40_8]|nr:MAG: molybdopterin synthase catalytic subunit MoaE [Gammaproteobacteria bacterium CG22_combo_CG10-13_8_21_14_all_40_8]
MDYINIQTENFQVQDLYQKLIDDNGTQGALATFVGLVRSQEKSQGVNPENRVLFLTLEHYPAMTQKALEKIIEQARERWDLGSAVIVHRVGTIDAGEQIVFVGVTSSHRKAAFDACEFIMDYLKTKAPFWKKETTAKGTHWVEAKTSDEKAASQW